MKALLEIAVFNLQGAIVAAEAGADRIELCVDYAQGGLTPPPELTVKVANCVACPVFVMIRPKAGDFVYSAAELEETKRDIVRAKQGGAGGFVFGILKENGAIDEAACMELIGLAAPLPCTFHRAFDGLQDKAASLEQLIRCGFRRVLTSGGAGGAANNIGSLKALAAQAAGRIIVMPGGGIRLIDLEQLAAAVKASEYHSAAIISESALPDGQAIADMKRYLRSFNAADQ